jgi:hypothetical protein
MNYKIIQDEQELQNFIDNILPDLCRDECYYISLFARKKYARELIWSSDKSQLKRLTVSKKSDIIKKLRQLEVADGCYTLGDRIAPQDSLVVYIHTNPRSQLKAARNLAKKLMDIIVDNASGFNVQQEALSAIQGSASRKHYVDFDFDLNDKSEIPVLIDKIGQCINIDCCTFVETRGGLHCLVKLDDVQFEYRKTWYPNIQKLGCDEDGDCMIPIPGTCQGGFIPKVLKK